MQDMNAQSPVMSERRVALLGAVLAGLGPLSLALFTPAMPVIAKVFATDPAAVKLTLSVYFAGFAIAQLLSGVLADRFGRKIVTQVFLLAYVVGSLGSLLAPSIGLMIWFRLLQGCGAAAGVVMSRAIVRDLFSYEDSARVLNVINIMLGVAPAVAPAIGSGAMLLGGWQGPFVLMLVLGVLSLLVIQIGLVETRPEATDTSGNPFRDYAVVVANPVFLLPAIAAAFAVATFYTQSTVLSFVVMDQLGYDANAFGLLMLLVSSGYFFGSVLAWLLMPRLGAMGLVPIGLGLQVLATFGMAGLLLFLPLNLVSVTAPVTLMMLANSLLLPGLYAVSLAPFPDKAAAASAMSGFLTMGAGVVASVMVSFFPDPSAGLTVAEPVLGAIAMAAFLAWRRLQPGRGEKAGRALARQ
jgi:DHA1 family bicyclomycin/chloramphenicol resistance-like MFS transporter